jgi:hypothetical protein
MSQQDGQRRRKGLGLKYMLTTEGHFSMAISITNGCVQGLIRALIDMTAKSLISVEVNIMVNNH